MKSLIVSCCEPKLQGTHKAIELYQNKAFKLIRRENLSDTVDIWINSALHGLIHGSKVIDYYDFKLNKKRQTELIEQGRPNEYPLGELYVFAGKTYRDILDSYFDNTIPLIGQNRGIGDHYSTLIKFVRENKPQQTKNIFELGA